MSLCLFNPLSSRPTVGTQHRDGSWHRRLARVRAAPNSLTRSGPIHVRGCDCRTEARRPRNLSVPINRSFLSDSSIPKGVTARHWRVRGGIETPGGRWLQRLAASAQLDIDSVVGPPRSPAPHEG